jgi:hypothetical protein
MNEEKKQSDIKWQIVAFNTLGLLVYTVLCRFNDAGIIIDCMLVGMHFFIAIILGAALRKREWYFSALIVLVIGFSTCVTFVASGGHGL